MTSRWRASPPADLRWIDWDGGSAVYHRPSGRTHFVNAATVWILRDLLRSAADEASVTEALRQSGAELTDAASFDDYVGQLLLRLEELGLVERA